MPVKSPKLYLHHSSQAAIGSAVNKASASNPGGYAPMLWFFGILSFVAFACMLALWVSGWRKPAAVAGV